MTPLEIEYLQTQPKNQAVIVDSNITPYVLQKISDYHEVVFMVTTPEISSDQFFNRMDKKTVPIKCIKKTKEPEKNLKNFKDMLLHANRQEVINDCKHRVSSIQKEVL